MHISMPGIIGYTLFLPVICTVVLIGIAKDKDNVKSALTIIGAAPFIILGFLLSAKSFSEMAFDSNYGDSSELTHHQEQQTEYEYIKPYVRSNPDGIVENNLSYKGPNAWHNSNTEVHYVKGHARTDGDPSNNLSK